MNEMCKIRTGSDITKISDIQNMITGYMLRQNDEFTIEDITSRAKKSCIGCQIDSGEIELNTIIDSMADNTLMALLRNDYLIRKSKDYFIVNV